MYQIMDNDYFTTDSLTMRFIEVYPTVEDFITDYNTIGLTDIAFNDTTKIANLTTIYYVLMGEYANSKVSNSSLDMFRYRLMTKIMSYGPEYIRKLGIQKTLLTMTDDDLMNSSEIINNSGRNPSNAPAVISRESLEYLDSQSATLHKRSKLDAYAYLVSMLDGDITRTFINKFADLFRKMFYGTEVIGYEQINTTGGAQ